MTDSNSVLADHLGLPERSAEQAILQLLIELAAQVVGAEEGSLLVLDRSQGPPGDLVFALTVGSSESEGALAGQRVPVGQGLTGLAALTHEVQIGAPTYDGVRQAERGDAAPGQPSSVIAAPMLVDDTLVGVITAVSFEPGKRFSRDDANLYARAASVAGVVVDQRRRLDGLEILRSAESAATGGGERDRLLAEILGTVTRIAQASPRQLAEVARVLSSLEALLGRQP